VGEYARWLGPRAGAVKIWPIVQASGEPKQIPAAEFEAVMRQGVSGGADGIMMFTTRAVAEDPAKTGVLRRLYQEWAPAR
jgi:hypothetical protein